MPRTKPTYLRHRRKVLKSTISDRNALVHLLIIITFFRCKNTDNPDLKLQKIICKRKGVNFGVASVLNIAAASHDKKLPNPIRIPAKREGQ